MRRYPFSALAAGLGAFTFLSLAPTAPPRAASSIRTQDGTTGVVSRVHGRVRVSTPFPIRAGRLVAAGSSVVLNSDSASVTVICANDREVQLNGPIRWQVNAGNCTRDGRRYDRLGQDLQRLGRTGSGQPGFWGALVAAASGGHVEYDQTAVPRRIYPAGSVFHHDGDSARLALLCSTDAFVSRDNPRNWTLGEEACAQDGVAVEPGAFRGLVGFAGLVPGGDPSAELLVPQARASPGPPERFRGCAREFALYRRSLLEPGRPGRPVQPPPVRIAFSIEFLNGRCEPIRVSSMDSTGSWVQRGVVQPDGEAEFESFIAQPWRVEAASRPIQREPGSWAPIALFLAGENQRRTAMVGRELVPVRRFDPVPGPVQDATTGLVSRVSGDVSVIVPFPIRAGTLLARGSFVVLGENAGSVVLYCADDFEVRLSGPVRWPVDYESCERDGRQTDRLNEVLARFGHQRPDGRIFGFWGAVVASADGGRVEYEQRAWPRRLYPAGSIFRAEGDSGRIAILCSTDTFVLRQNLRDWTLSEAACARDGSPVEAGAFRDLVGFASLAVNDPSAELLLLPLARVGTWPGCERRHPLDDYTVLEPRRPDTPQRPLPVRIPTTIYFINGLCGPIRLSSMDSTGEWVHRGTVEPDGRPDFESFISQPWLVEADSNATRAGPVAWAPVAVFLAGEDELRTAYVSLALSNAMTLCRAIDARRRVSFVMDGEQRLVEPHAVGEVTDRRSRSSRGIRLTSGLLAWQETPDTTGWVRFNDLAEIGGLRIRDAIGDEDRPGYEAEMATLGVTLCRSVAGG